MRARVERFDDLALDGFGDLRYRSSSMQDDAWKARAELFVCSPSRPASANGCAGRSARSEECGVDF